MKTTDRILQFLRDNGYEPVGPPQRTYAGANQRSAGAWSWFVDLPFNHVIGSQWSMTEVLAFENPVFSLDHGSQHAITPD